MDLNQMKFDISPTERNLVTDLRKLFLPVILMILSSCRHHAPIQGAQSSSDEHYATIMPEQRHGDIARLAANTSPSRIQADIAGLQDRFNSIFLPYTLTALSGQVGEHFDDSNSVQAQWVRTRAIAAIEEFYRLQLSEWSNLSDTERSARFIALENNMSIATERARQAIEECSITLGLIEECINRNRTISSWSLNEGAVEILASLHKKIELYHRIINAILSIRWQQTNHSIVSNSPPQSK
jgi:hypothetical protein